MATELRKLLLWLTLECFRNSFENRSIRLVGLVVDLKNDQNGRSLSRKWAWLLKILRATVNETPLLEILDPPLKLVELMYSRVVFVFSLDSLVLDSHISLS